MDEHAKPTLENVRTALVLLCDLDGTLVNTNRANFSAYRRAVREVTGREVDFDPAERLNRESLRRYLPDLSSDQLAAIAIAKEACYREFLPETAVNLLLERAITGRATGRTVLVTRCRRLRAEQTLQHHNLLRLFDLRLCREELSDSQEGSKHVYAFRLLGELPDSAIVCEDDAHEIEIAIREGVPSANILQCRC